MEPVQNGESSRSPARRSTSPRRLLQAEHSHGAAGSTGGGDGQGQGQEADRSETQLGADGIAKSRLILPEWDIPPPKPLHPSHDLISLLSLASLYNTYVRPYASGIDEEPNPGGAGDVDEDGDVPMSAGLGGQGKKRGAGGGAVRKLERGYMGLLDDCIDPVPNGNKAAPSLVPLIQDLTYQPSGPPPELWDGPIEVWPVDKWSVARLEVGSQSGYKGGEKEGVRKAEEKRRRKREAKAKALLPTPLVLPSDTSNPLTPNPMSAPGTPLLPVAPPSRAGMNGFAHRRQDSTSGIGTSRPPPLNPARASYGPGGPSSAQGSGSAGFRPAGAASRPGTPSWAGTAGQKTPGSAQPGGVKRVYEGQGAGMSKKAKVAGTRSASPMPTSGLAKGTGLPAQGQAQTKGQTRPGLGKGPRARTEGM